MRITTLGCNASITGELRTTCYLVDDDILIDAGTGAGELSLAQSIAIDTVFLTHSHLDHCGLLPMLADAAGSFRDAPLTVYALPETIATLEEHMLNNKLWPDYTVQPMPERPYIRFRPILAGETVELGGRRITALPARHAVPCVGYRIDSGKASLVYSADTTLCEDFWLALNRIDNLKHLLIETTFRNDNAAGAARSGHTTANLLAQGLRLLERPVELFIVHMEAGYEEVTMREVLQAASEYHPQVLRRGHVFEL
ncbi:cAMP phosphodiesterase class-II:metallo-beta-lactamase superfamily protein [Ferrigenium kumadai]|uniref:cAMP phosphodiesterase class-II:metallo-beta-lactamase superfamily protein n=1 Tax=Ferrigenium kumadai TaxID=1682490 RepID=A0AAN1VYV3_9PROT|nr:3',5'-cyclic-nucleotide phosphodiesterase [Ferrigenium kumadai]BBI98495.1 cAMP phosphodiesterase class-II:metallo-beta-lactamase superfamily protein [Ferrigenium kumadai]